MNELKIIDLIDGIEIQGIITPTKLWVKFILLFLMIIGFIVPIILVVFLFDKLTISIVLPFLIFWGTSTYFLKLYLWNSIGKEIIRIQNNHFTHYFDYKYFKDGTRKFHIENINIELVNQRIDISKTNQDSVDQIEIIGTGKLEFVVNDEKFNTQVELSLIELRKIKQLIEQKTAHNKA